MLKLFVLLVVVVVVVVVGERGEEVVVVVVLSSEEVEVVVLGGEEVEVVVVVVVGGDRSGEDVAVVGKEFETDGGMGTLAKSDAMYSARDAARTASSISRSISWYSEL
jgi:hypothetical protein